MPGAPHKRETNMQSDGYLNVAEAARFVGLSASTLNKLRTTGAGPRFLKPVRRVLYERDALLEWMRASQRTSTSDGDATKADALPAPSPAAPGSPRTVASYAPTGDWLRAKPRVSAECIETAVAQ